MRVHPYDRLDAKLKRSKILQSVAGLLQWDEQVNLPENSADARQEQNALLSQLCHEAGSDPELGRLLDQLEGEADRLDEDQRVVAREARKHYDRATKLPARFVEAKTRLSSQAYHAWVKARREADYPSFAPFLQKQLELSFEYAEHIGWEGSPYDAQIDLYDPGMTSESIAMLFDELRAGLAPIVAEILKSPVKPRHGVFRSFPVDRQRAFLREVTTSLGFDYSRGRIDTSPHPFCSGDANDIRMTTRFDENNPLDSLFSSIHETGHGLYEQGLPRAHLHNALGQAAGMGAHESQSRLWENQVCRGRPFWRRFEPKFRSAFSEQLQGISSDELYLAVNSVTRNPIRVDADEVTYNLHIIVRFEIERKLFARELEVAELSEYWTDQYKLLLDVTPDSDAAGVLQDVHWSSGAFGYFPSYCLGNMLAAQLWYAALEQIDGLEAEFAQGNFSPLLQWLREKVHRHGARYQLPELAQVATGQPLSPQPLLRYLRERYLPLYR